MKTSIPESLLNHPFSEADTLWLNAAAENENFDPRVVRAILHSQLPRDYNPQRIDQRFYQNGKLTLIGTRRFKPGSQILQDVETLALAIKKELLDSPGIDSLLLDDLATRTQLSKLQVRIAAKALSEILPFFSGSSTSPTGTLDRVWFTGPYGYDVPLRFTTLDDALDTLFQESGALMHAGLFSLETNHPSEKSEKTELDETRAASPLKVKKNTAFVIMPIDPERPELVDVLETIKEVATRFGIKAYRADEIEHQDRITNVILEEIKTCEYLIADLSHERPNVYYEVGYAHALDKRPILFRRQGTRLHFDLSVHNVPEYRNVKELRELLTRRFEAILGRSANPAPPPV